MSSCSFLGNRIPALLLACVSLCLTGLAEPTYERLCQQGRQHLLDGQYAEAQSAYSKAVAYQAQRQYDQACEAASKAIKAGDSGKAPLVIRATAYHALGKHKLAIEDFNAALEIEPKEAAALAGRGRVYLAEGDESQARFDFSKAIEYKKDDPTVYVARGKLYAKPRECG